MTNYFGIGLVVKVSIFNSLVLHIEQFICRLGQLNENLVHQIAYNQLSLKIHIRLSKKKLTDTKQIRKEVRKYDYASVQSNCRIG